MRICREDHFVLFRLGVHHDVLKCIFKFCGNVRDEVTQIVTKKELFEQKAAHQLKSGAHDVYKEGTIPRIHPFFLKQIL